MGLRRKKKKLDVAVTAYLKKSSSFKMGLDVDCFAFKEIANNEIIDLFYVINGVDGVYHLRMQGRSATTFKRDVKECMKIIKEEEYIVLDPSTIRKIAIDAL